MRNNCSMKFNTKSPAVGFGAALLVAACSPARSSAPVPIPVPVPAVVIKAPLPARNPKLPEIPEVRGPLNIKVQYPGAGDLVNSKDSNFIHGQVGNGDAGLTINGVPSPVWPNGAFIGWLPVPRAVASTDSLGRQVMLGVYDLIAVLGSDTARLSHTVRLPLPPVTPAAVVQPVPVSPVAQPTFAAVGATKAPTPLRGTQSAKCYGALTKCLLATPVLSDTDRVVVGRPTPTGTYKWFLIPGTSVQVTGTQGEFAQVQLDNGQLIWIAKSDLNLDAAATKATPITAGTPRLDAARDWVDVNIPANVSPAFLVETTERGINLTLYSATTSASSPASVASTDSYVTRIERSGTSDRLVYGISLTSAPYGYMALYQGGIFTLRLRRPPAIDPASPLRGLTIAVDPGHPPVGATGPTGLWEPQATLPVGFKLRDMLLERGANVVMTRTAHEDVDLAVRPTVARKNDAHAFVSIHLNALPDGVNPHRAHGTSTYWFYPHSTPLARHVQRNLLNEMGLADKGTPYGNFAVIRGSWMPSVLAEGAFIMIPDQEAAMRTAEYQAQYARGILLGLEDYFRSLAQQK